MTLLSTKFYFPSTRPHLISRPQLLGRLCSGLKGPLTLICAPAGYGKTTLMSEWRAGEGQSISAAWLSLEEGDNDLVRFLSYLVGALEIIEPNLGMDCIPASQSPKPPVLKEFLPVLLNRLDTLDRDCVLVLDDYHVIVNPDIHGILSFILENPSPRIHLTILTRKDPPLPIPRLRERFLSQFVVNFNIRRMLAM